MYFIRTNGDRFAIEQIRQIELLLIRVLVDCLPVKISLKQNAPKQLQRFDYLFLVYFFFTLCLFKRSTARIHTNGRYKEIVDGVFLVHQTLESVKIQPTCVYFI